MNPDDPSKNPMESKSGVIPAEAEQRLKQDAAAVAETAKRDLETLKSEAEGQIQELAGKARDKIGEATEKAKGLASEQKEFVAGQLEGVAAAVTKVADELEGEQAPTAQYARTVAEGIQRFSETMRNRDVDDLIAMAEDFGRRQPVAFMGAAALAGFLASRFLLASAKRRNTQAMAQSGDMQGAYGSSSYAYSERAGGSAGTGDTMGGTI